MTPFGATLRRLREDLGLSQTELASRLSLHSRVISAIETGRRQPPPAEVLVRWAQLAGFTDLELQQLDEAAKDSAYLIRLPKTASPRALKLAHRVMRALAGLQQGQISAIHRVLEEGEER